MKASVRNFRAHHARSAHKSEEEAKKFEKEMEDSEIDLSAASTTSRREVPSSAPLTRSRFSKVIPHLPSSKTTLPENSSQRKNPVSPSHPASPSKSPYSMRTRENRIPMSTIVAIDFGSSVKLSPRSVIKEEKSLASKKTSSANSSSHRRASTPSTSSTKSASPNNAVDSPQQHGAREKKGKQAPFDIKRMNEVDDALESVATTKRGTNWNTSGQNACSEDSVGSKQVQTKTKSIFQPSKSATQVASNGKNSSYGSAQSKQPNIGGMSGVGEVPEGTESSFGLCEAPVFYPTAEEFADPNAFLERIYPLVAPFGICRIVPPKDKWNKNVWRTQIDPSKFTFTTKSQAVHTLQHRDGEYLQFMTQLQFFWSQVAKNPLKRLPELDSLPIDLLKLNKLVETRGGLDYFKTDFQWQELATELKLDKNANYAGATLASTYRKILVPFNQYISSGGPVPQYSCGFEMPSRPSEDERRDTNFSEKRSTAKKRQPTPPVSPQDKTIAKDEEYSCEEQETVSRQYATRRSFKNFKLKESPPSPPSPSTSIASLKLGASKTSQKSKTCINSPLTIDLTEEEEEKISVEVLSGEVEGSVERALNTFSDGHAKPSYGPYGELAERVSEKRAGEWRSVRANSFAPEQDAALVTCFYCNKGDNATSLVLCDTPGCSGGAHLGCMRPARTRPPFGRYYCPSCKGEVKESINASFGAIDATRETKEEKNFAFRAILQDGSDVKDLELFESLGFGHGFGGRYTLAEYKEMATKFANFWFDVDSNAPNENVGRATRPSTYMRNFWTEGEPTMVVSAQEIEKEYWKLSNASRLVRVHYGSDVDVAIDGSSSGFPLDVTGSVVGKDCPEIERWQTTNRVSPASKSIPHPLNVTKEEITYMRNHGWNLNSLPYVTPLRWLNESISGVTRPMMYIGMLFSSFCWHTEDNWLYSINYIHSGAPKRWYGVAGKNALDFENALKAEMPHLFAAEPQLLFQLTTIINPNILKRHGVKLCTTLQSEGEFVVTFPRAYHSGFNCGFNVAESVNFATHRWLDWGLCAANEYRFARSTVFAHEKFVWLASQSASSLTKRDISFAIAIYRHLILYLKFSKDAIKQLRQIGIKNVFHSSLISHEVVTCEPHSKNIRIEEFKYSKNDPNREHIYVDLEDEFESNDPQCFVCGYDVFMHRVDCACMSPRIPRCLKHAEHKVCACSNAHKFISYRFNQKSVRATISLLENTLNRLGAPLPKDNQSSTARNRMIIAD